MQLVSLKVVLYVRYLCNFSRTFQCNFCCDRARDKYCKCKLATVFGAISERFRTCLNLDTTCGDFGEIASNIFLES